MLEAKVKSIILFVGLFLVNGLYAIMPNIHSSGIAIDPIFSYKQMYDSNIFLQPKGQAVNDLISNVQAGLNIDFPLVPTRGKDIYLQGLYRADLVAFWRNTNRTRVDHNFAGAFNSKFMKYFNLYVKETFRRTADPPNSERTQLYRRIRNVLTGSLATVGKDVTGEVNYDFIRDKYDSLANLSKYTQIATAGLFWRTWPKVFLFLEYDYSWISYDNNLTNSNSTSNQGRIGVDGLILNKLQGMLKMGYRYQNYREKSKKDFSGFVISGKLRYDFSPRTRAHLVVQRSPEESSYSINSYYTTNFLALLISHALTERLNLNVDPFIRYNGYSMDTTSGTKTEKRQDWFYGGMIGLKYEIREWVFASIQYEIKDRDSNFSEFCYLDQKAWGIIGFEF